MTTLLSGAVDRLYTSVGYVAGGPVTRLARGMILSVLNRIQVGQIIIEENGETITCGSINLAVGSPPLPVTLLRIKNDSFWTRVAIFADMVGYQHYTVLN